MAFFHQVSAGLTDIGRKRSANEDSILLLPDLSTYCVADGMGGVKGGEFASQKTLSVLGDAVIRGGAGRPLSDRVQVIRLAADQASGLIKAWADERGYRGTGTTLVALLLDADTARGAILHAGDSRAYRFRAGRLEQMSRDHSVVSALGTGETAALPSMFQNLITRAVGLSPHVELELTEAAIEIGDTFLLCSDGLSKMVPDGEMARRLGGCLPDGSLPDCARALVEAANGNGGEDNISVVLVRCTAERPPAFGVEPGEAPPQRPSSEEATILGATPPSSGERQGGPTPASSDAAPLPPPTPASRRRYALAFAGLLLLSAVTGIVLSMNRRGLFSRRDAGALPPPAAEPTSAGGAPATDRPAAAGSARPEPAVATVTPDGVSPPPATASPGEPFTAEALNGLVAAALSGGDWGALAARVEPSESAQALLQSSDLRRVYRDWLAEWRNQFQNAHAVEAQLAAHVRTVNDLCRQVGAQPWLAPPVPVWPPAPQDRATLFCAQVYAQQQHFLDGFGAFASRARAATRPFGSDPEQTLAGLWSLTRTAGVERRQTTETLGKLDSALGALERWVANNRQRFLSVAEAERGVQAYEPQIAGYVDAVWTSLRARVESVPLEALRAAVPKGSAAVGLIDEAVALRARIRAQGQGAADIAAWRAAVDAADLGRLFGRLGDVQAALQQDGGAGAGGTP